ncbi:MAG: oligoendopeptidase F [Acidobacteria bacterium]|nr:MAG: oligoendopeptidase F [Acidobacteriota bacterium]
MNQRVAVGVLVVILTAGAWAQQRDRASIPERYKWDLTQIYPSNAAWRAAKEQVEQDIPSVGAFKGTLGASPAALADALQRVTAIRKSLARLSTYANLQADEDTRHAEHQGLRQEMTLVGAAFGAETAFMEPEILQIGREKLRDFLSSEPRLATYRFYLEELFRREAHTLSEPEERILAALGPVAGASSTTSGLLLNAEFPYPTVTLSDGRTLRLDQQTFADARQSPNRADREKVMSAYFGALGGFSQTLGSTLSGAVLAAQFHAKARRYESDLAARLDYSNIPVSVYSRLIDGVNRHLPSFHRYLNLRKRMLGVDELHYYDLYAPLVGSVELSYTPEEAQTHIAAAVAPLGADYAGTINRAFNERWIDLMPNVGKRSGAYATGGAYDVHPYTLINYNGKYYDVSTVAHELGHAMHSFYSNRTQPFELAGYHTFVAEVASQFNEDLLLDYVLKQVTDRNTRIAILGNYLETLKATVFRQTQFADFELRAHQMAQQGKPLTGDSLARLYLEVTKNYYGHDQGACVVDEYVAHEWSGVPHFYSSYYVFQYATSFTAATALSEGVLTSGSSGAEATRRYLRFLSSGGSKYPIDLLKDAGVDMTGDQPLELTIRKMNRVMDEVEKLLGN